MKRFLIALPIALVGGLMFASAAAVAFPDAAPGGALGAGEGAVSGYSVTNVHWGLESGNVTEVTFTISGTPDGVQVATNGKKAGGDDLDGYDNWVCGLPLAGVVTCNAGAPVSAWSVFQLSVTAAN